MISSRSIIALMIGTVISAAAAQVPADSLAPPTAWPDLPAREAPDPDPLGVARLESYLAGAPPTRVPSRDPFRFGNSRVSRHQPSRSAAITAAGPPVAGPALAKPPALIGIAEEVGDQGFRRIAVFSAGDNVEMATEGQLVGNGRFRLDRIRMSEVLLTDVSAAATLTVVLR